MLSDIPRYTAVQSIIRVVRSIYICFILQTAMSMTKVIGMYFKQRVYRDTHGLLTVFFICKQKKTTKLKMYI